MYWSMNFSGIWNKSKEDYYILFNERVLLDSCYFLSNMASKFDNFFLGHKVDSCNCWMGSSFSSLGL